MKLYTILAALLIAGCAGEESETIPSNPETIQTIQIGEVIQTCNQNRFQATLKASPNTVYTLSIIGGTFSLFNDPEFFFPINFTSNQTIVNLMAVDRDFDFYILVSASNCFTLTLTSMTESEFDAKG